MSISARLTKGKHCNDYAYCDIEVIANTETQAENICIALIEKMQEQLNYYNASSVNCPWAREHKDKMVYGDSIAIDYDRGAMQDTYKEIMKIWKDTKKKMSIR